MPLSLKGKIAKEINTEYWKVIDSIDKKIRALASEYGVKISSSTSGAPDTLALKNASSTSLCVFKKTDRSSVKLMIFINHSEIASIELLREALDLAAKMWPKTTLTTSISDDNKSIEAIKKSGFKLKNKESGISVYTKELAG